MPFTRSPASLALPCEVEFPDRLRDGHSLRNEDHARRAMVAHEFTEMMRHRSLVVANEQSLAFRAKRQNLGIEFAFQCCGTRRLEVCGWFELPESGDDLLIQVGVGLQPQLHEWVAKSSRRACAIFSENAASRARCCCHQVSRGAFEASTKYSGVASLARHRIT